MIATLILIASTGLSADLRVGQQAIPFSALATDMTTIKFPESYAGKLVLLDFWATFCGPCRAEIPNVRKAYADHHANGFEVLGVSLDRGGEGSTGFDALKSFTTRNRMPWHQIYGQPKAEQLYGVERIPFVLLVDGDSGKIIATTNQLRGPGLSNVVGRELAKKFPPPPRPIRANGSRFRL